MVNKMEENLDKLIANVDPQTGAKSLCFDSENLEIFKKQPVKQIAGDQIILSAIVRKIKFRIAQVGLSNPKAKDAIDGIIKEIELSQDALTLRLNEALSRTTKIKDMLDGGNSNIELLQQL